MAKAIKKKKPKATNTANATALFTEEQMSVMMKKVMASMKEKYGDQRKPKHQVHYESSSDSDNDSDKHSSNKLNLYSLDSYIFDNYKNMEAPMHKLQDATGYSAEIIVEIVDSKNEVVPIRALLDTGTSETILLKQFLSPNSPRGYKGTPVKWKTLGGNFITHCKAKFQFAFPELSDKKYVT
jgi:hypothetical protein